MTLKEYTDYQISVIKGMYPEIDTHLLVVFAESILAYKAGKPIPEARKRVNVLEDKTYKFMSENEGLYPPLMYKEFVEYWTTKTDGTQRWKLEKKFQIASRLSTWYSRNKRRYNSRELDENQTATQLLSDTNCKRLCFNFGVNNAEWYKAVVELFIETTLSKDIKYPRLYTESKDHFFNYINRIGKVGIENVKPLLRNDTFSNKE